MDKYLFFSAEAESPAGYYLMEMWNPVEMDFNATHIASEYGDQLDNICIVFICTSEQLLFVSRIQNVLDRHNVKDVLRNTPECRSFLKSFPKNKATGR